MVDSTMVDDAEAFAAAYIEGILPGVDASPGTVVRELVVRPHAVARASLEEAARTALGSLSLTGDNAELLLNNINIYRRSGTVGQGVVRLEFTSPSSVEIPASAYFTSGNGSIYRMARAHIASTDGIMGDYLVRSGDVWSVDIPVTGTSVSGGTIAAGTSFTLSVSLPNLYKVYAAMAFSGGAAEETVAQMAARASYGPTAKAVAGRANIEALVCSLPAPALSAKALAAGDPGMSRGSSNPYGASLGGYVDVRVRTLGYPVGVSVAVTPSQADGVVSATLSVPGLQLVETVSRLGLGIPFTLDYGDADLRGSAHQKVTMTIDDPDYMPGYTYNVGYLWQPGLEDMQAALDEAAMGVDILARLANPVFLWVDMAVSAPAGTPDPAPSIQAIVASHINSRPVGTTALSGSELSSLVMAAHPGVVVRDPVVMDHLAYRDDGTSSSGRSLGTFRMDTAAAAVSALFSAPSYINILMV